MKQLQCSIHFEYIGHHVSHKGHHVPVEKPTSNISYKVTWLKQLCKEDKERRLNRVLEWQIHNSKRPTLISHPLKTSELTGRANTDAIAKYGTACDKTRTDVKLAGWACI